jgi:Holliday junction resolvase RusA-like endonuclease
MVDKRKRLSVADIKTSSTAVSVPKGYAIDWYPDLTWDLMVHIFAPIMPSPRPRVTTRGTFMPSDYRAHCNKLGCSLAYARALVEQHGGQAWDASAKMHLDLAFWSKKMPGDLDNLAKTIMDSAQLHKNEEPGAELWANDRQIVSLSVQWIPTDDEEFCSQTVIQVRYVKDAR